MEAKRKLLWVLFFAIAVFVAVLIITAILEGAYAQTFAPLTERDLGRAPLLGPGAIETKQDLYERIGGYKARVVNSIELGELKKPASAKKVNAKRHADLIESAVKSDIGVTGTDLPIGATILWMGWHSAVSNAEQVLRHRAWQGKAPLPGFLITIQDEGEEFKYFVPKVCGNLAFLEAKPLPPALPPKAEAPLPPKVEAPPQPECCWWVYVYVCPPPPPRRCCPPLPPCYRPYRPYGCK